MQTSPADPGLLAQLGWIDLTALAVLVVFFVLGLFRGFVWQCSRIVTLVLAYVTAGSYGDEVADRIGGWFGADPGPLPLYIAYFAVFLVVLILVSLIAHLVDRLVVRSGLSFYNRLGGGMLGIVTGACVVMAMLAVILMFFGTGSDVVHAAQTSRSMAIGRESLRLLGDVVPEPVREVFAVQPSTPAKESEPPVAPESTGPSARR